MSAADIIGSTCKNMLKWKSKVGEWGLGWNSMNTGTPPKVLALMCKD